MPVCALYAALSAPTATTSVRLSTKKSQAVMWHGLADTCSMSMPNWLPSACLHLPE